MTTRIPEKHHGMHYHDFMSMLSQKRSVKRYFEIGVEHGKHLSLIQTDHAVAVDPAFDIRFNIINHKKTCTLVQKGSDQFFLENDLKCLLGGSPDLALLDGMHTFEFLLRDFFNTEAQSAPHSLIALHDCMPLTSEMTIRDKGEAYNVSPEGPYKEFWTGDVWKVIPILQEYRKDLRIVCVDCYPTGLVFITNLDPDSRVLQKNYHEIVQKFAKVPNDARAIENFYENIEIVGANDVIRDFDHSLYFST